ncbi:MAG: tyrosine-type recombinase/integrase [Acidimicrobiia bacterium]|nr:tyrosine-type recombinase/integrase [Gemmatimonadota bacterium]MDH3570479.1 tyrosine-type recombinase/integrase [Gemmatimonadota bacterium]MDH5372286.1 tyrosine-type recombinase/integrase [Acidimicrobiia bacterium]MDH5615059.1 tyrosine-type recombinase/integrase [Acidimicrobiia bacterium]
MATGSGTPASLDGELGAALSEYVVWLERQPLAERTRDAYRAQVESFLVWLSGTESPSQALVVPHVRDWAVRDYKRFLKRGRRLAPSSVNQALAAIDSFYRCRAVGRPDVDREQPTQVAPRALDEEEQRALLRAVERCPSRRDGAIATMFLYTGLRLSELAGLEVGDVAVTARKGMVTVRSGKGDRFREVPLNSACRTAVTEWLEHRQLLLGAKGTVAEALWVSRLGQAMSKRAVGHVVERLAADAGLEGLSAHVLRHTFVTNLIRSGADVVLVAELAGHRRLDTTRRYSLPSEADRAEAVESVLVEP